MKKKILILVILLGVVGAGIAYYLYNKPVASLAKQKADVQVSAAKLVTDYGADESLADQSYLGKVVEVTGTIAGIETTEGTTKVIFDTGNPMSAVICEMETAAGLDALGPGDEVRLKGLCSGYLSDVILVRSCLIP